jgi:prepilin-type N-terminal cleavage/methylation domain-containing protein
MFRSASSLHKSLGFTLIEIMVVISVIAILTAVVTANFSASSEASRDAKRQSDLRAIQTALEAYKNRVGRYPAQATSTTGGGWSGQLGTIYAPDDGTGQYIVGLAPEYIPVLPTDPKLPAGSTNAGYVYRTNGGGTVYKLMAINSVESETVTYAHEFSSCDITGAGGDIRTAGWCSGVFFNGNNRPAWCLEDDARFQTSYGVWGGFAPFNPTTLASLDAAANPVARINAVRFTTDVICR